MATQFIKSFLTVDFTAPELESYNEYLNGNLDSTLWIEKADERRSSIIAYNLRCKICMSHIGIKETGECFCINGHDGSLKVLHMISNHSL